MKQAWWKEAVVYQIYPRSFYDSNGDGVGDLRGIIQKLDYIQSLGVDAVWLNPIYESPYDDGGYDISNYYAIHPEFGTLTDFDELVGGLHTRGLRLIMDLVVNHSSDEHQWFVESRQSKSNRYRDYYFWRAGKGDNPPNNWPSFFGGSAWQKDEATGEYYLHLFSRKQPDLNWENPALRQEVAKLMRFWLDKGVDGLRLDVISAISKRTDFPDTDTTDFNETIRRYYANGPRLKEFIAEMRHQVWNHYHVMTVGEGPGITPDNALDYLDEKHGLDMIFHFGHMFMDQGPGGRFDPIPWTMAEFKQVFQTWDDALKNKGWGSIFLGNHDFARMVSRWGNDREHWEPSAKLLLMLLLSMRGTPFVFAGDEIGMTNTILHSVAESKDIETLNGWREAQKKGITEREFLAAANYAGRDNARTPFHWSAAPQAGFTNGQSWMSANPNHTRINAAVQQEDKHSILSFFKQMRAFRKAHPVLTFGRYSLIPGTPDRCFGYIRESAKEKLAVVLNFSGEPLTLAHAGVPASASRLLGNYPYGHGETLRPWEGVIFQL
jgi:oligo-1,6-glucosidase